MGERKIIINSRAPVRISFGGGGTDVDPFCKEHGGAVISAAINRYAYSSLEVSDKYVFKSGNFDCDLEFDKIEDMDYDGNLDLIKSIVKHYNKKDKYKIFLDVEAPPRSGLGSSASAFASVIGLFNHMKQHERITDYEVAELAYNLEREELKNAGGRQDQYAAVFGGLNYIEFKGDNFVRVNPLKLKKEYELELEKNLLLVHIGSRKDSGDIIGDQNKNYEKGKNKDPLFQTKEIMDKMKYSLLRGELDEFGNLLDKAWKLKKQFSKMVSNSEIDKIYDTALNNGALGGKITGAGGGGHMLFYCPGNTKNDVLKELLKLGVTHVPFNFDYEGLVTWEIKNE
ncbi:GHMP kinase [Candidatus Woesearchaeota archaeon]|nr:MAG: GHMP kinase [Candidatus Woesearchaeota archaeon]